MVSWESQSHSSIDTTQSNSRLSETNILSKSTEDEDTSTGNACTAEFSLRGRCNGLMGVPITFLDKYNPDEFEIIGSYNNSSIENKKDEGYVLSWDTPTIIKGEEKLWNGPVINKRPLYKRIVIKRRRLNENRTEKY